MHEVQQLNLPSIIKLERIEIEMVAQETGDGLTNAPSPVSWSW